MRVACAPYIDRKTLPSRMCRELRVAAEPRDTSQEASTVIGADMRFGQQCSANTPRACACQNLVKGRMSCVGQRWSAEGGIVRVTAFRVRIFIDRCDDLWRTPADRLVA